VRVLRPSYRLSSIDPIVVGSSSGICQRTQARLETLLSANNTCKNVEDAPAPNTWAVDMASEQKSRQLCLYELQLPLQSGRHRDMKDEANDCTSTHACSCLATRRDDGYKTSDIRRGG
jgi:hypothetical protein